MNEKIKKIIVILGFLGLWGITMILRYLGYP